MNVQEVKDILLAVPDFVDVYVELEGTHYKIIVVSDSFESMTKLKQQQAVYSPLMASISDGTLHAVTIKTFTSTQWQREKMFNMPGK